MNHPNLLVTEKVKHLGVNIQRKVKKKSVSPFDEPWAIPFFYSTPKELLSFYNMPLKNFMVSQLGCTGIKCNSPI